QPQPKAGHTTGATRASVGGLSSIGRGGTKEERQRRPRRKNKGLAHIRTWYHRCSLCSSKSRSSSEGHACQTKAPASARVTRILARLGQCEERPRRGTAGSTK